MSPAPAWRRHLITAAKVLVSLAILAILFAQPSTREALAAVWSSEKHWGLLLGAIVLCWLTVLLTIFRWVALLRALNVPISLWNGLRLGGLGFMLHFVSLGSVGGDAFKAIFLMRDYPRNRPESVASVLVDRVIGLVGLFLVVSVAALLWGELLLGDWVIRLLVYFSWAASVGSLLMMGLLWTPLMRPGRPTADHVLEAWPRPVRWLFKLGRAVRMYRNAPGAVGLALLSSVVSHGMFAGVIWLLAWGLPVPDPTFESCLVVSPLANLAAVAPLPMGGLGAMEAAMAYLFVTVPGDVSLSFGEGSLVAFAFRLTMIAVALSGFGFYLASRREFDDVYHDAEEEASSGHLEDEEERLMDEAR